MTDPQNNLLGPGGFPKPSEEYEQAQRKRWVDAVTVPREIRTIIGWVAQGDPVLCVCGHEHYARLEVRGGVRTSLAPQWGFCEDPACRCTGLRRVAKMHGPQPSGMWIDEAQITDGGQP